MPEFNFEITVGRPKLQDYKVLSAGMLRYHRELGHPRTSETINIFLKDSKHQVTAGLSAPSFGMGLKLTLSG